MPNSNFVTDGLLGAKLNRTTTLAEHRLGERRTGNAGTEWIYVQASGAITGQGYVVNLDPAYAASMFSTANDARGNILGVPPVAFADQEYGWVQVRGPCQVRVSASAAANVRLNATATVGQVDDDGTTGAFSIEGMYLTTAKDGTPGLAPAVLADPVVSVVL